MQSVSEWSNSHNPKERKSRVIILDEVSELENWENIVSSLVEDHKLKARVIISGSNSKLLASDLSTNLSGRYVKLEVFPFSFHEYMASRANDGQQTTKELFSSFEETGGIPEVGNISPGVRLSYLESLQYSTLQKDVTERYNPTNPLALSKICLFFIQNYSNETSLPNLVSALNNSLSEGERIGVQTAEKYLGYLIDVYFIRKRLRN